MPAAGTLYAALSSSVTAGSVVRAARPGGLRPTTSSRLEDDPDQDPYDPNGVQTLCRSCHIAKTARENRRPLAPAELRWRVLVTELLT